MLTPFVRGMDTPFAEIVSEVASKLSSSNAEGWGNRNNRSFEYDSLGNAFSKFLLDELLPFTVQKFGVKLTDDPELRAIADAAEKLPIRPWEVVIDGEHEQAVATAMAAGASAVMASGTALCQADAVRALRQQVRIRPLGT